MGMSNILTKSMVGTIVAACVLVFSVFLFLDSRYFHSSNAESMEIKLAQALNEQMKTQRSVSEKQLKLLDLRQLEQLKCSEALLEKELERTPNDRFLKDKLGSINKQIKQLEKDIYGIE